MKKAHFYTFHKTADEAKIVEADGFSMDIDGEEFYVYEREDKEEAYIIDPKTGLSLYSAYRAEIAERIEKIEGPWESDEENKVDPWEIDLAKYTAEEFKTLPYTLNAFRSIKKKNKEGYAKAVRNFLAHIKKYKSEQEDRKTNQFF